MPSTKAKLGNRGRKPALRAVIDLPAPPPQNSAALALARWRDQIAAALNAGGVPAIPGHVAMTLHAAIFEARRSLAELTGTVIAELATRHVIEDADAVTDSASRWDRTVPAGMVRLVIKQTREPAERIGADTRRKVSARARERFTAEARP
jgi:hypothetical protein